MNRVILMGRLTADPEIRYTQGSQPTAWAKFSLAVDRRVKKENEQSADFINCTAFGKTAEFCERYVHKGTKVALEGRWQTGSYTNREGARIYTNECMVDHMEFAESKKDDSKDTTHLEQQAQDGWELTEGLESELPFV